MGEPLNNLEQELNKSLEEAQSLSGVPVDHEVNSARAKQIVHRTKYKSPEWQAKVHKTYLKSLDNTPSLKHICKMTDEQLTAELHKYEAEVQADYLYAKAKADIWDGHIKTHPDWPRLVHYTQYNEPIKDEFGNRHVIDLTESPYCKEVAFLVFQNLGSIFDKKPEIIDPENIMSLAKTYTKWYDIEHIMKWLVNSEQGRKAINDLARSKWEDAGEPIGRDAEFWLSAEKAYMNTFRCDKYRYDDCPEINCDIDKELKTRTVVDADCPELIRSSYYTTIVEVIGDRFKVTVCEGFPKPEWVLEQEAVGRIIGVKLDNMRWWPTEK